MKIIYTTNNIHFINKIDEDVSGIEKTDRGEATNIRIYEDTKKELESIGKYGETHDDLVKKVVDFYKAYKGKLNGK